MILFSEIGGCFLFWSFIMRKRAKWFSAIIILLICVGLIINWFNMGVFFEHSGGFEWSHTYDIFNDIFPELHSAYIQIGDDYRFFGIKRVFWFLLLNKPPHAILIHIDDKTETMRWIVVKTITVDYGNNEIVSTELDRSEGFKVSQISEWIGDGKSKDFDVMTLDMRIPFGVEKNRSCTIKMNGYFIDSDKNKIPFETSNFFEYEPTYWRVYTGLGAFD